MNIEQFYRLSLKKQLEAIAYYGSCDSYFYDYYILDIAGGYCLIQNTEGGHFEDNFFTVADVVHYIDKLTDKKRFWEDLEEYDF